MTVTIGRRELLAALGAAAAWPLAPRAQGFVAEGQHAPRLLTQINISPWCSS